MPMHSCCLHNTHLSSEAAGHCCAGGGGWVSSLLLHKTTFGTLLTCLLFLILKGTSFLYRVFPFSNSFLSSPLMIMPCIPSQSLYPNPMKGKKKKKQRERGEG